MIFAQRGVHNAMLIPMQDSAARSDGEQMIGEEMMTTTWNSTLAKRRNRRDFLKKSTGAAALAAFGIAGKAFTAEPVNIGGLYPLTGSFAQIGQGCVNAS